MIWTAIDDEPIKLKTDWQYTEPIEGEYFRLRHAEAPNDSLFIIAQAIIDSDGTVQMFDSQVLSQEHSISDVLRLKQPGWATERRLALKKVPKQPTLESELKRLLLPGFMQPQVQDPYSFVRSSQWLITIEKSDYLEPEIDLSPVLTKLTEIEVKIDSIEPSGTSQPSGDNLQPKTLAYVSNGDDNGVFYWLGSNGKTTPFSSPAQSGKVSLSQLSYFTESTLADKLVDRDPATFAHTHDTPNASYKADLTTKKLIISAWSIKARLGANSGQNPQAVNLQASNNDYIWIDIEQKSLANFKDGAWFTSQISNQSTAYKYWRIVQATTNDNGQNYFVLSEWELYGELISA